MKVKIDSYLKEVVPSFLAQMDENLPRLTKAAIEQDGVNIGRIAHEIKGSAGALGFEHISQQALQIEELLRAGNFEGVTLLIETMTNNMSAAEIEYVEVA